MLYFNIEFGIPLGRFQLEISIMLLHWELNRPRSIGNGVIRHVSIGPVHASLTDRKRLKELFLSEDAKPTTLEELADL